MTLKAGPSIFILISFLFFWIGLPILEGGTAPFLPAGPLCVLLSFAWVFLAGGYFLHSILFPSKTSAFFEGITEIFTCNILILAFIGILTFECRQNVDWALRSLFILQFALWIIALIRLFFVRPTIGEKSATTLPNEAPFLICFAACVMVISYLYWHLPGFSLGDYSQEEESLHLGMMRKLLENPVILFDNFGYRPGSHSPYLYAPYHLAMAMTAKISGVHLPALFSKFRSFSVIFSFCMLISMANLLFQNHLAKWAAAFLSAALCFSQIGAEHPAEYWGAFAPYAYPREFASGLLLPGVSLFLFKALTSSEKSSKKYLLLAPFLIVAVAMVHVREAFHLLLYVFFILLGFLWLAEKKEKSAIVRRALFILLATAGFGITYFIRYQWAGVSFGEKEWVIRTQTIVFLKKLFHSRWWGFASDELQGRYIEQARFLLDAPGNVALMLIPFLVLFRKNRGPLILFSIIFFFFLFFRIPILHSLTLAVSFSETFIFTLPFIYFWCLLILGLFFYVLYLPARKNILAFLLLLLLLFFSPRFETALSAQINVWPRIDWVNAWILGGSLLFLLLAFRIRIPTQLFEAPLQKKDLALLLLLAASLSAGSTHPNLWQKFQKVKTRPDIFDEAAWYRHAGLEQRFPFELISFIRKEIPPHSVFIYDRLYGYELPMHANQYVVSAGGVWQEEVPVIRKYLKRIKGDSSLEIMATDSTEEKIRKYYTLLDRHMEMTSKDKPVFNPNTTLNEIQTFMQEMEVGYILIHPQHYNHLVSKLGQDPLNFEKIYDRNSFVIYKFQK